MRSRHDGRPAAPDGIGDDDMELVTAFAACREPEARSDSFVDIMKEAHLMTERPSDTNRWPALIIICLGYLIELDVTIVGVALPSIREDLGFSASSLAWVATHTYSPSSGSAARGSMHPPRP